MNKPFFMQAHHVSRHTQVVHASGPRTAQLFAGGIGFGALTSLRLELNSFNSCATTRRLIGRYMLFPTRSKTGPIVLQVDGIV